jgi:hypothetical protein
MVKAGTRHVFRVRSKSGMSRRVHVLVDMKIILFFDKVTPMTMLTKLALEGKNELGWK